MAIFNLDDIFENKNMTDQFQIDFHDRKTNPELFIEQK